MIQKNKFAYIRYITRVGVNVTDTRVEPQDQREPESDNIKIFIDTINYNIDIGTAEFLGLSNADLVTWYMKPISITMSGVSIMTDNPFIASDDMILSIYNKLSQHLNEPQYNFYKKPRFNLYIQNGIQKLNSYEGVISGIKFDESTDYPDKYKFTIEFRGIPNEQKKYLEAESGKAEDDNSTVQQTRQKSSTQSVKEGKPQ